MFVVAGSTGNVGGALVNVLAARGVPVRAITRDPARARFPDGVEAVGGDLNDPASLADVLAGSTGVFLLSGYADMPGLLSAVRGSGAERVALLSSSSVPSGDLTNAVAEYHIRSEQAVRESGVPGTFLRPSAFAANALRWKPQLDVGDTVEVQWASLPAAVIAPSDIAAVAAVALVDGGYEDTALRLTGPEALLPAEQVRLLGEALGRPLVASELTDEQTIAQLEASMPAKYVDAFRKFYLDGDLDESVVLPTVEQVLGRPPQTFAQWAAAHAAEF